MSDKNTNAENILSTLSAAEILTLRLKKIYENFGYSKFCMNRFEPYDIYRENKNFLSGGGIITFTGQNGRLMALRPDVTLSIVKSIEPGAQKKLYYHENVFRAQESAPGDFREISQLGLESIGAADDYSIAEVVMLARESLALIGEYTLNLGHMGILSGLAQYAGLSGAAALLPIFTKKDRSALTAMITENAVSADRAAPLWLALSLSLPLGAEMAELNPLCVNEQTTLAVAELRRLAELLPPTTGGSINIDFSAANDPDYYNGITLAGYIKKAGSAVLAGGRYDRLLQRFSKPQPGLGFALYLSELDRTLGSVKTGPDVCLIYGDLPPKTVQNALSRLIAEGKTVLASKNPPDCPTGTILTLTADGEMIPGKEKADE